MIKKICIMLLLISIFPLITAGAYSSNINPGNPYSSNIHTSYSGITSFGNFTNLSEMQDVQFSGLTNNQHIVYNSSSGLWVNSDLGQTPFLENSTSIYPNNEGLDFLMGSSNIYGNFFIGDGSMLTDLNISEIDMSDYYSSLQIDSFSLSRWIDNLGNRGYSHLSNFTNDLSKLVYSDGSFNTALIVDALGNIGIGTTTPQNKLNVIGTINATSFVGDGSQLTGLAGGGDINEVSTDGKYLTGGADSGTVSLLLNETVLNQTIESLAGTSSEIPNQTTISYNDSQIDIILDEYEDYNVTTGLIYNESTGLIQSAQINNTETTDRTINFIYDDDGLLIGVEYS